MNHLNPVTPLKQTTSGAASTSLAFATGAHLRKSAARRLDALLEARLTTSVKPRPQSFSQASSPGPRSRPAPTIPERLSAGQKRFCGVAKYLPTLAE